MPWVALRVAGTHSVLPAQYCLEEVYEEPHLMVHALVNAELPPELMSISCAPSPDQPIARCRVLCSWLLLSTAGLSSLLPSLPAYCACLRFSCGSASFGLPQSVDRKQHAHSNYMRSLRKRLHSS